MYVHHSIITIFSFSLSPLKFCLICIKKQSTANKYVTISFCCWISWDGAGWIYRNDVALSFYFSSFSVVFPRLAISGAAFFCLFLFATLAWSTGVHLLQLSLTSLHYIFSYSVLLPCFSFTRFNHSSFPFYFKVGFGRLLKGEVVSSLRRIGESAVAAAASIVFF